MRIHPQASSECDSPLYTVGSKDGPLTVDLRVDAGQSVGSSSIRPTKQEAHANQSCGPTEQLTVARVVRKEFLWQDGARKHDLAVNKQNVRS